MNKKKLRKELAALLRKDRKGILQRWSEQIFKVPGHNRLKDIVTLRTHRRGMDKYLRAFIRDIEYPQKHICNAVTEKLILKDYLSASNVDDTIHGQIILRDVMIDRIMHAYKKDVRKLRDVVSLVDTHIDYEILCIARVYSKRDFSKLETIMKYGKKLITIYDLDKLCDLIIEAAVKESNADRASLMLLDKYNNLYIKSSIGIAKNIIVTTTQRLGVGIAGMVAKTGKPIIINEGQHITPTIKSSLRGLSIASAVSIPIIHQKHVIGVLNLGKYSKKPFFDEEDTRLLLILAHEAGTAIVNCRLFTELEDVSIGSIISLATALETRDYYTTGHSNKVTKFAVAIGKKLKLSDEQIEKIHCASMLHDIGKIGIPDRILHKPGRLTAREFNVIKKHPIFGASILKHIPRLKSIVPIIYHEHERFDGTGYVEGIKGEKIPIESRIIAVADAYDAMISDRPYRKALPKEAAVQELKRCSGTQFDPKVVNAFLKVIKR